jgi:hypothetical protein
VLRLLVAAGVAPGLPFLVTLMLEAIRSSETLVYTTATRRSIPEDVLRSPYRDNLESYIVNRLVSVAEI